MSNADELLKYKELLDNEIITQEEFEKKKSELLNSKPTNATTTQTQNKPQNKSKNVSAPNKKDSSPNGCLIAFITVFALIVFWVIVIMIAMPSTPSGSSQIKNLLVNQYSLSEENAQNIINVIDKCGYADYYSGYTLSKGIDNDEIPDSLGFEIMKSGKIVGFVDIKGSEVCLVQYSDKILYKDGAVQHTLSEYVVSSKEKEELILKTKNGVQAILKSPSTAKFPWNYDEWNVGKKDGSTIVQGYVDSQNGFGATVRSTFQVTYTNDKVTSLIFDGTEYIK